MNKLFGWLTVFLLLLPIGFAQAIDSYSISYQIVGNYAFVSHDIVISNPGNSLNLELPSDAKDLTLAINNLSLQPTVKSNFLQIPTDDLTKEIIVTYISKYNVQTKDEFLTDIEMPSDVKNLDVKTILPENAMLRRPLSEGGVVVPKPMKVETDGLQIFITWNAHNLKKDDRFGAFILYKTDSGISPAWYFVAALIAIVLALLIRRNRKSRSKNKILKRSSKHKHEDIESHLKDDEKQIVNVLKQRDGQCEQGTLRVVTGMPKASLSRLLMELEARNVIYKEKKGKKNVVFLK